MFARISNGRYAVWMFIAFGFLACTVLFFPVLLGALVPILAGGRCGGGACGALAVVLGIFLKPMLILIGAALAALATFRRVRGTLSGWWAVFAGMAMWGSAAFLFGAGNFWGANFAVGMLRLIMPWSLLSLVVLTVFLSLDIEGRPAFSGRIAAITGPFGLPIGALYIVTAIWLSIIAAIGLPMLLAIDGIGRPVLLAMLSLNKIGLAWLFSMPAAALANSIAGVLLILCLFIPGGGSPAEAAAPPSPGTSPVALQRCLSAKGGPPTFGRRKR